MRKPGLPAPRWGTERNPQRETLGPRVAEVARRLGWDLMPWQRHVLDIGCELDTDGTFWYRDVRTLVPRQSGKTTIFVAKGVHRALTTRRSNIIYTAQDRQKAATRLEENYYERVLDHWRPILQPTRNALKPGWYGRTGSEHIRFVTGSKILIDANNEKSGHGGTNREWHCDEVFAHKDATVAQNIRPTLITVNDAQIWHQSAAGKLGKSDYWWDLVQDGRARVEARDPRSRIAYFEWSDDEDNDRNDPALWWDYMPALGWTITERSIEAELEAFKTNIEEYDRAYRGIWTGRQRIDPLIPAVAWDDNAWLSADDPIDWSDYPPVWCLDIAPDQEWSSIGVAGRPSDHGERRVTVRLVDHELGTHWVVDRLRQLRDRYGSNTVAVAGASAAMGFKQDLEDDGFDVVVVSRAEIAAACAAFYADAVNRLLWHTNDDALNEAFAGAVKHAWGDAWVYWRGRSKGDVSPAYAVTIARYVFLREAPADGYDPVNDVM